MSYIKVFYSCCFSSNYTNASGGCKHQTSVRLLKKVQYTLLEHFQCSVFKVSVHCRLCIISFKGLIPLSASHHADSWGYCPESLPGNDHYESSRGWINSPKTPSIRIRSPETAKQPNLFGAFWSIQGLHRLTGSWEILYLAQGKDPPPTYNVVLQGLRELNKGAELHKKSTSATLLYRV